MRLWLVLLLACASAGAAWPRIPACGIDPSGSLPEISPDPPANSSLLQVLLVTRHGDRTISSTLPPTTCWLNDQATYDCSLTVTEVPSTTHSSSVPAPRLYRKNYLPSREIYPGNCMTGQLTSIGYAQHVLNGKALRKTYVDSFKFLPSSFDPALFFLRSDDVQRTTQSLEALMLGFFPPSAGNATQVLDFYTMDLTLDTMSPTNANLCPFQNNVTLAQPLSPGWQSHFAAVTLPLYTELAQLTGLPLASIQASHLLDCMRVHVCHGLALPAWFNLSLYDAVANETLWQYHYTYTFPNATVAARVGIGHLWADLLAQMRPSAGAAAKRFVYFSGHDTTIYSLLTALDAFADLPWPPYASLLLFELWQPNGTTDINVRIIFNGEVLAVLPFGELAALIKPILPGDICTTGVPLGQ